MKKRCHASRTIVGLSAMVGFASAAPGQANYAGPLAGPAALSIIPAGSAQNARGREGEDVLAFATLSAGGRVYDSGTVVIVGQALVGTLSSSQFTMVVGPVPGLLGPPTQTNPPVQAAAPHDVRKHRYISIDPSSNADNEVAYKVELVEMLRCTGDLRRTCSVDADCPNVCDNDADITCSSDPACSGGTCVSTTPCVHHPDEGLSWWVQEPEQEPLGCRLPGGCTDEDWFARLDTTPHFQSWDGFGVVDSSLLHISDCQITPVATYAVSACAPPTGDVCSDALIVSTILIPPPGNYGDVVGIVDSDTVEFTAPNQILNVTDVSGYLLTNQNYGLPGDPEPQAHWTWVDMEGQGAPFYRPQAILNVGDLNQILFGLMGRPYSWAGNNVDPGDCP
ncbi:MAG: hypothetical protein JSU63_03540 [Phycisphaerales bacterium]|nr:MAG: hypothetical protein JSU63_03540 [Phycisphaerales bacterium]